MLNTKKNKKKLNKHKILNKIYNVIVIGGGHAGCEAATASARMGC